MQFIDRSKAESSFYSISDFYFHFLEIYLMNEPSRYLYFSRQINPTRCFFHNQVLLKKYFNFFQIRINYPKAHRNSAYEI